MVDVPSINESIRFYWNAYQDLCSERPVGSYATIPYFKIKQYAEDANASVDDLKRVVWAVDKDYLDYMRDKSKAEAEQERANRQNLLNQR